MINQQTKRSLLKIGLIWSLLLLGLMGCAGQTAAPVSDSATKTEVEVAAEMADALDLPVDVNVDTVEEIRHRDDVVLVDVREGWEYDEGHIPGVTLIPLGEIEARISEIPTDKTVVVLCRSGNRSNQATTFLRGQGLDNVHNMQGGMLDWQASGYEVEK